MANTTVLKRRIHSVKNTRQITKAMELVAASKMRRAQEQALSSRAYREAAHSILKRLGGVSDVSVHPLFNARPIKSHLIVVVTSDRGLAGAYNSNVIKELLRVVQQNQDNKVQTEIIAIGRIGSQFVARIDGVELLSAYSMFSGQPHGSEVRPIVKSILDYYVAKKVDSVSILYTSFVSNLTQQVEKTDILPTKLDGENEVSKLEVAIFEPSIEDIVESTVSRLIEVQIWQAILESLASEHSMRMLAMKNATDNAGDIIDDLTLEFNTARQAAITQEIAEIVGGAEAVKS